VYLDLDELPALLRGGYGISGAAIAPASFRRADHLGDPQVPLADAVRDLVQQRTGWRPTGPIRLLTLLRNWGYYFNPLSLYYCFAAGTEEAEAVVAEVTNTPWRERHWYVLWQGNRIGESSQLRFRHPKEFHVSPFLNMDMTYEWHIHVPGEQLTVALSDFQAKERVFDASFALKRRDLTRANIRRALVGFPWLTARVIQAIHWQAFRLWRKKCPLYPHPKHLPGSEVNKKGMEP
jgi:DUF1365 family protein